MSGLEEVASPEAPPVVEQEGAEQLLHPEPKSKCKRCVDCKALLDNVGPGVQSWDAIRTLVSPTEFEDFEALTNTDEEHYADMDGLLAEYSFDGEIECSFPGSHRHLNGIVAKMLCETVLRMGLRCASKYVVNFTEVKGDFNRRKTHQGNLLRINGWLPKAEQQLDRLERVARVTDEVLLTMKAHLPSLFQHLKERRKNKASGVEIPVPKSRVPTDEGDVPAPAIIQHLVGLALFDGRGAAEVDALRGLIAKFRKQERDAPPLDGRASADLSKIASSFARRADGLVDWLRECAPFTTERNLSLALVALRRDNPRVTPEAGGFRVGYFPTEEALLPRLLPCSHASWLMPMGASTAVAIRPAIRSVAAMATVLSTPASRSTMTIVSPC